MRIRAGRMRIKRNKSLGVKKSFNRWERIFRAKLRRLKRHGHKVRGFNKF